MFRAQASQFSVSSSQYLVEKLLLRTENRELTTGLWQW
jgi:hypothetical protein